MRDSSFPLGLALARVRLSRGLSVEDVAARLDVQREWVERLEAGNTDPRWSTVIAALQAMDAALPDLARGLLDSSSR